MEVQKYLTYTRKGQFLLQLSVVGKDNVADHFSRFKGHDLSPDKNNH